MKNKTAIIITAFSVIMSTILCYNYILNQVWKKRVLFPGGGKISADKETVKLIKTNYIDVFKKQRKIQTEVKLTHQFKKWLSWRYKIDPGKLMDRVNLENFIEITTPLRPHFQRILDEYRSFRIRLFFIFCVIILFCAIIAFLTVKIRSKGKSKSKPPLPGEELKKEMAHDESVSYEKKKTSSIKIDSAKSTKQKGFDIDTIEESKTSKEFDFDKF